MARESQPNRFRFTMPIDKRTREKSRQWLIARIRKAKLKERLQYAFLPDGLINILETLYGLAYFTGQFFRNLFRPPFEFDELVRQCVNVGNKSVLLVGCTAFIMGVVMTLQSIPVMAMYGAESMVPSMVSISIVREIGPVITALICAGRVGSGMGAEIGSMKVTQQIDAMAVSATNPFNYIVVTRVIATTTMVPLLIIMADAIGIFASFLALTMDRPVSLTLFVHQAIGRIMAIDLVPALIKSVFFGFAIGIISCYEGYKTENGTQGVGRAANGAVVVSSLAIFILDMLAVQATQVYMTLSDRY